MSKQELYLLLLEQDKRKRENKLFNVYDKNSDFNIDNYPKQKEFYHQGATKKQRAFVAANRVGKTEGAAYEIICHAIGWYPSWWTGKKFPQGKNLTIWVVGNTSKTIRDILQNKLLGPGGYKNPGEGFIPKKYIKRLIGSPIPDLADKVILDRIGGGTSTIQFKNNEAGRITFEGTEVDIIWLDEEPPIEVYSECVLRTMTTDGIIILTFTPLKGMTPLITLFFENAEKDSENYCIISATWDDVPHLSEKQKADLFSSIPEFQRDARTKGIPQLGSGAIYRISLDDILVDTFEIPKHWKKLYALDVGWNTTACLWGAINPENEHIYIYDEMYVHKLQPYEYARIIKSRGDWIEGVIDTASLQSSQTDGHNINDLLKSEGLKLSLPDKSVETGIFTVWEQLSLGKLKVFKNLKNFQDEYKIYRRDEKGQIVKEKDHLMDCLRYLVMSKDKAKNKQNISDNSKPKQYFKQGWMN